MGELGGGVSNTLTWAQRVYESDKRSAEVCRQMQIDGFAYDSARAKQFSDILREAELAAARRCDDAVGRQLKRTKSGGISTKDLMHAFFDELRAPTAFVSELTGKPSLGANAMQAYAICQSPQLQALAKAELERRRARKIRSTYIDAIIPGSDGRVHPSWLNYGTISGRWSCQAPNLANLPKASLDPTAAYGGIRSLYVASPGYVLIAYDKSQIEFRIAAYGSGDEAMIAACEGGDVHAANAEAIFGPTFTAKEYKRLKKALKEAGATDAEITMFGHLDAFRSLAKSAVFAVCYLAEAETVYQRILASGMHSVKLRQVEAMLTSMKRRFQTYYRWQDERLMQCIKDGYTSSPILGRRRYLGHDPAATECANFPIQSGAADVMNAEIPQVMRAVHSVTSHAKLVAHVYDSVVIEVLEKYASAALEAAREVSLRPITIATSGVERMAVLPIDCKTDERWS